ncbi:MAG TPA: ATP-binding protein [Myxococcaceae bacterium]|nr:ATP-binding protein [Myxococcaceae bacterium]
MIAFEQPELSEQQLADLSAKFVALAPDQVDAELDRTLRLLLGAYELDRGSIAEASSDGQRLEVTHTQSSPHAPAMLRGDLAPILPWYAERVLRGELLQLERIPEDLPAEATAEREYCTRIGLRSQLTIPFTVGNRVIGGIGFSSFQRVVEWTPRLVRSIRLVSEVLANAVARKQAAHEQLQLRAQLAHSARLNAMGEVVASIAHEVNQPLFGIVSNARAAGALLGRETPDLAEIGAALDDIVQDANRASGIIARVRGFLQRKPTRLAPLDVNSVIETVQTFLGLELSRRRVTLELVLGDRLPPVVADRVELQQVLVNLLMNGAEAMEGIEPGQRRLKVCSVADGSRVRIDVADRGPGLGPEVRARLFEAFFTTKPGGLGMGLAICKSILEAHGGRIQAVDGPGGGTLLQVWLPTGPA